MIVVSHLLLSSVGGTCAKTYKPCPVIKKNLQNAPPAVAAWHIPYILLKSYTFKCTSILPCLIVNACLSNKTPRLSPGDVPEYCLQGGGLL